MFYLGLAMHLSYWISEFQYYYCDGMIESELTFDLTRLEEVRVGSLEELSLFLFSVCMWDIKEQKTRFNRRMNIDKPCLFSDIFLILIYQKLM